MTSENTGAVLERLERLERAMEDILTLVRQIDIRLIGSNPDPSDGSGSEAAFYDAEGGE